MCYVNNHRIDTDFDSYYTELLGLTRSDILSPEIITRRYDNILRLSKLKTRQGVLVQVNILGIESSTDNSLQVENPANLRAAKEYLIDSCKYRGGLN